LNTKLTAFIMQLKHIVPWPNYFFGINRKKVNV
jgi:hypothetical protein